MAPDLQTEQVVLGRHKQEHSTTPARDAHLKTCLPKQRLGFKMMRKHKGKEKTATYNNRKKPDKVKQ